MITKYNPSEGLPTDMVEDGAPWVQWAATGAPVTGGIMRIVLRGSTEARDNNCAGCQGSVTPGVLIPEGALWLIQACVHCNRFADNFAAAQRMARLMAEQRKTVTGVYYESTVPEDSWLDEFATA